MKPKCELYSLQVIWTDLYFYYCFCTDKIWTF